MLSVTDLFAVFVVAVEFVFDVEFVFAVEDHFKISMPDQDVNIDTLAELAAMVDKALAAQAAPAQSK